MKIKNPTPKTRNGAENRKPLTANRFALYSLLFALCSFIGCVPPPEVKKKESEVKKDVTEHKKGINLPEISEAKKYYSFGCEYLKNKMYDEAIKNFKHATEDSTTFVDAYINLGLAHRWKNEREEMERVYKEMIEIAPAKGHYALGRLYTDEKRYNEALAEYKSAIIVDSSYVDAWYGIGYVEEKLGNIKSAIQRYEHVLTLDPENKSVRYSLGKAYIANGEYEKGIKELKVLRASHPEDIDVRRALGDALISIKNYKEARAEFEYITGRLPSDIPSRIELGKACEGLKDYECAAQSYKEAILIDTTNITPCWYLIFLYLEIGNINKAEEFLSIVKLINPESQQVRYLSGTVLIKKGDKLLEQKEYTSAMAIYNKAIVEYELVIKGEDPSLIDSAKKAIESAESKLKRAKEEEWWHRR